MAFKFRSKIEDARWRSTWDWALFVAGLIPALIFGVAFGNVMVGAPFRFDETLRMTYEGNLFGLLNPFALLCGLVSVYLSLKTRVPVMSTWSTPGIAFLATALPGFPFAQAVGAFLI